jgi:hypothetical protein
VISSLINEEAVVRDYIVPIVTAVTSTLGAIVSVIYGRRATRAERLADAEDVATRFREPLLQAVFNLQTRIYNIVEQGFIGRFMTSDSSEDEREYAVVNTMYVFAQYFCWVEIVRRGSLFVDPSNLERNRFVAHRLEAVRDTFADSLGFTESAFRLFRGEQRALGELLLVPTGVHDGAPRWECLGYAAFVDSIDREPFEKWFRRLRTDIVAMSAANEAPRARLLAVHERLMDIIDALDPEQLRIPEALRRRPDSRLGASADRVGRDLLTVFRGAT